MQNGFNASDSLNKSAQNSAKAVSENVSKMADQAADIGSRMSRVKDQFVNVLAEDADIASKMTKDAIKQIPNALRYIETGIRRHPFTAAGVALGLGAVAVKLLSRNASVSKHI